MANADLTLIFAFNTESGIFNLASDLAQKIMIPYAERCNLRKLAYTPHGEKLEWKNYLESLSIPYQYLFKDEFMTIYPNEDGNLPAVYVRSENKLTLLLDDFMIYTCESIEDLTQLIKEELMLYRNQNEQKRSS